MPTRATGDVGIHSKCGSFPIDLGKIFAEAMSWEEGDETKAVFFLGAVIPMSQVQQLRGCV